MMPAVHRRGEKSSSDGEPALQPSAEEDWKKRVPVAKISRLGGAVCFLALYMVVTSASGRSTRAESSNKSAVRVKQKLKKGATGPTSSSNPMADYLAFEQAFEKYGNCTVSYVPPPPKAEWETKPLWLSAFPGSGTKGPAGKGDILKPLINGITGLKAGAKFYHASSKGLKRCKGWDETAACANGHPKVPIGPEKQTANFYHSAILVVRNYKSVFPTYHSDKAEAYHGATGQVEENNWRETRDSWYKSVFDGWKTLIMTWKNMEEYDIGLYLKYENLFDPERGPSTVQRMADLFKEAGFSVAPKEDIPCIWFQTVKEEYQRLKEYWTYASGFTKEQRDEIMLELDKFQKEVAADKELAGILKEYYDDIRDNTLIDVPFKIVD